MNGPAGPDNPAAEIEAVQRILDARRDREAVFGAHLFADVAWDLLLVLYIAEPKGKSLGTTAACDAAAVPLSTALRHLEPLVEGGWIERRRDPRNARRVFLELSSKGARAMRLWLHAYAPGVRPYRPVGS